MKGFDTMRKLKRILLIILIVVLIGPIVLVILNFIPVAPFSYKGVNSFRKLISILLLFRMVERKS